MAVRGYAFTHQKDVLAPYDKAVTEGLADLIALNDLEAADPGQLQEVTRIRAEFDELQNQWALPTIEKARAAGIINTPRPWRRASSGWARSVRRC